MFSPVIPRIEAREVESAKSWLLVYGRRKTGKTFMIKRIMPRARYYLITRGRSIVFRQTRELSLSEAVKNIVRDLKNNKTVVIDEFQRLPEEYWDLIAAQHPRGKLIAVASSLAVTRKVFNERSPLLGIMLPLRIGVANPFDPLCALMKYFKPVEAIKWAMIIRDPWIIPHLDFEKDIVDELLSKASRIAEVAVGLVGEVFIEEERNLTTTYNAILRAIACNQWNTSLIASKLASKKIIPDPNPSRITSYIKVLEEVGLVRSWRLYRSKQKYLKLTSSILQLSLCLDEKLGLTEAYTSDVVKDRVKETIKSFLGYELGFYIVELLALKYSLTPAYYIRGGVEIDGVLLDKHRRPVYIVEIKSGVFDKSDARSLLLKARELGATPIAVGLKEVEVEDKEIIPLTANDIISDLKEYCESKTRWL